MLGDHRAREEHAAGARRGRPQGVQMANFLQKMAAAAALAFVAVTPAAAQDWQLDPNFGTVTLISGFEPDPYSVNLIAGGDLNVANNISGCLGWITRQPDYRLHWQAGNLGLPLVISVTSNADTTLVINGPDTRWYCDDDGGNVGLNPSVTFTSPASGQYDIWVGTYAPGNAPAQLSISELFSQ